MGRAAIAGAIATDVRLAPTDSGFVIGLAGPWGSGKTSVLELAGHELGDEVAAVVRFNPWLFSGADQLVSHFFAEIAGQLEGGGERLTRISGALSAYGRLVSPLRNAPVIGGIAGLTSEAAEAVGQSIRSKDLSAELQAQMLRAELLGLPKRILVLVDDLDRLRPGEIVDVVRLIRLVGDFPNLVYVLAFDQGVVESALAGNGDGDGAAYLEKIIHVPHRLPPARPEDLTRILENAIADLLADREDLRIADDTFLAFWSEVRPMFETVRDVRRYVNALRSTLDLVRDEVDLGDILTLEAIRLFEPDSFEEIIKARYLLTGTEDPLNSGYLRLLFDKTDSSDEAQIRRIAEVSSNPGKVEQIVRQLFPAAERYLGGASYAGSIKSEWRANRRVASGAALDAYLHRRVAPGVLPTRQVESMAALFSDKGALERAIAELDDQKARDLYMRLADYRGPWSADEVQNAVQVIMDRGVGFRRDNSDIAGPYLIGRLLGTLDQEKIVALLRSLDYPDRSRHLDALMAVSPSSRQQGEIPPEQASALRQEFRSELLSCEGQDLVGEPYLGKLISILEDEDRDRLNQVLPRWVGDDAFLVEFVAAHRIVRMGARREVQLDWPALSEVLEGAACMDRLSEIELTWVRDEFDDDRFQVWRQARRYSEDPEEAASDLAGWRLDD